MPLKNNLNDDNLRALVSEWEKLKTEKSKQKIGVDTSPQE